MNRDPRSRKWLITINNPEEKGLGHEAIKKELEKFPSLLYWCMADEIGEEGTYHTHLYLVSENAIRASTLASRFPGGHRDIARGTSAQNRDYVFKTGKWAKEKKSETNLRETREEYGELPVEKQGARNDLYDLYALIKEGLSNYELLELNPEYMSKLDMIERTRQILRNQKYKEVFRELKTTYIFGETGAGKTRHVLEAYGYNNVYRVTDYIHPFDAYNGQDVLVFEEFRSSLKVQDMLNYLDGYPMELPSRYQNKVACYTKVYIITNIPLECQYEQIQKEYMETWKAFFRRIHHIKEYRKEGIIEYPTVETYFLRSPNENYLKQALKLFEGEGEE